MAVEIDQFFTPSLKNDAEDMSYESDAIPGAGSMLRDIRFLNRGSFGTVHTAVHIASGRRIAVKVMKKNGQNVDALREEALTSLSLSHPAIIASYEAYETAHSVYVLQEYVEGGDMFEYMEKSGVAAGPESQIKRWFTQIMDAVVYMHDVAGVVHRDIKPENVVLSKDLREVRLLDFGLSRTTDPVIRPNVRGRAGTDPYMAPEVFTMDDSDYVDGRAADIWSLGITLFAMIVGQFPWQSAAVEHSAYKKYMARHAKINYTHARGAVFGFCGAKMGFSDALSELLDRMLMPNPRDRITARGVLAYLKHPWLLPNHPLYELDTHSTASRAGLVCGLGGQTSAFSVQPPAYVAQLVPNTPPMNYTYHARASYGTPATEQFPFAAAGMDSGYGTVSPPVSPTLHDMHGPYRDAYLCDKQIHQQRHFQYEHEAQMYDMLDVHEPLGYYGDMVPVSPNHMTSATQTPLNAACTCNICLRIYEPTPVLTTPYL